MASTFFKEFEWIHSHEYVDYPQAVAFMEERVAGIYEKSASPCVWFVEHPPLYTIGTSGTSQDILKKEAPIFSSGRGGKVTYHGPGQRVIYVMMDLKEKEQDLRAFIRSLEYWILLCLGKLGFKGFTNPERIGVWVKGQRGQEEKIASIGVRVRRWVTFHGLALNVCPDLKYFQSIIPCGLSSYGVCSLRTLGYEGTMVQVDQAFQETFAEAFKLC